MAVKARFYVHSILKTNTDYVRVELNPVTRKTGDDNVDWSKYTPSGKIEMTVSKGTGAADWFERKLEAGEDIGITFDDLPE
jgi:hypothetical protein